MFKDESGSLSPAPGVQGRAARATGGYGSNSRVLAQGRPELKINSKAGGKAHWLATPRNSRPRNRRPSRKDQDHGSSSRDFRNQHGACGHSRHIAQGVTRRDRHLGHWRGGVGGDTRKQK